MTFVLLHSEYLQRLVYIYSYELANKYTLTVCYYDHNPCKPYNFTPFQEDWTVEIIISHTTTVNQEWGTPSCAPGPPCPEAGSCLGSSLYSQHFQPKSKPGALVWPPSLEFCRRSLFGCQVALCSFWLMGTMKEWQQCSDNPGKKLRQMLWADKSGWFPVSQDIFFYPPSREATARQECFLQPQWWKKRKKPRNVLGVCFKVFTSLR